MTDSLRLLARCLTDAAHMLESRGVAAPELRKGARQFKRIAAQARRDAREIDRKAAVSAETQYWFTKGAR